MAQWVKNLTAAAWITGAVWVPSPAQHSSIPGIAATASGVATVVHTQSPAEQLPYAVGPALK